MNQNIICPRVPNPLNIKVKRYADLARNTIARTMG
nr:MAG TPA: hypothetical protein [Caudoviricetes sp.]